MMPRIPAGMRPITTGYSIGSPGGVMRTEVGGGAPRYALEWDRGSQPFNVTLLLTKGQFSVWTLFYLRVIKKGSLAFEMPLDSGFGESLHQVNMVPETYGVGQYDGVTVMVTFVVEAESQAYAFSTEQAQGLLDLYDEYGDGASALMARLAQFATADTAALDF